MKYVKNNKTFDGLRLNYFRPLPAVPKKDQEEEVYEEMIEFPSNERYSAAPSLVNKINIPDNLSRGIPDGDEGKIYFL